MKRTLLTVSALALAASLALPLAASAEGLYGSITVGAHAGTGEGTTSEGANATVTGSAMLTLEARAKERADEEIDRRIENLNNLSARIEAAAKLTADQKASLAASLAAQVSALTTLKATIDADSSTTTLKADVQSITKAYRIYMLVLPQGRIVAVVDRVRNILSQFNTLGTKLSARIAAAQAAGVDVTALQSAYADFNTKLADADRQTSAALAATVSLKPDNGDATVAAANKAALEGARAKILAAESDLKAARADAATIIHGVSGHASVTATTTEH